jgi:hypothetical protein
MEDAPTGPHGAGTGRKAGRDLDFGFSDLEERLMGPEGAAVFRQSLTALRTIRAELEAGVKSGMPKDEFAQAQLLDDALRAAERILTDKTHLKEMN